MPFCLSPIRRKQPTATDASHWWKLKGSTNLWSFCCLKWPLSSQSLDCSCYRLIAIYLLALHRNRKEFGLSPQTHYQICKDYSPINLVVRSPYTQYGHKPDTQNTSNEYVQLYLYTCLFLPELKDAGKIENYGCERKAENYCYEGKTVAMKANINNNNYSSSPNSLDPEASIRAWQDI